MIRIKKGEISFDIKCSAEVLRFFLVCMKEIPCDQCFKYRVASYSAEFQEPYCEDTGFCSEIIVAVEEALYGKGEKQT